MPGGNVFRLVKLILGRAPETNTPKLILHKLPPKNWLLNGCSVTKMGEILKVFGQFECLLSISQILNLLWKLVNVIGQFFIVVN